MMDGVLSGYTQRYGIKHWWLDCDEPCQSSTAMTDIVYKLSDSASDTESSTAVAVSATAVGAAYPHLLARAVREAMSSVDQTNAGSLRNVGSANSVGSVDSVDSVGSVDSVMLGRSAWAGSQRYGVAVWSGDTNSSWASLREQVRAGLNMAMSGIVYWTTGAILYYTILYYTTHKFDAVNSSAQAIARLLPLRFTHPAEIIRRSGLNALSAGNSLLLISARKPKRPLGCIAAVGTGVEGVTADVSCKTNSQTSELAALTHKRHQPA
jgi:hypothetical protein